MAGIEMEEYKASEAAAWLEHVAGLKRRAAVARESVEQARALMLPQGIAYDGGGGGGCYADAIPDGVARVQELVARYAEEVAVLVDEEARAADAVSRMPTELYRDVLRMHYLCGMPWADVAEACGYCLRSVMEFRRAALAELWPLVPLGWRAPMQPAL